MTSPLQMSPLPILDMVLCVLFGMALAKAVAPGNYMDSEFRYRFTFFGALFLSFTSQGTFAAAVIFIAYNLSRRSFFCD
jgi:hypothetical protein